MREGLHNYFMNIAKQVATRATCERKHVGAVIVKDKHIISTGYNGAPTGMAHCDDIGHMMENDHCVRTVHAEANAIIQSSPQDRVDATLYTTASPCWPCFQLIANSRIRMIIFGELYRDERITQFAKEAGIHLFKLDMK